MLIAAGFSPRRASELVQYPLSTAEPLPVTLSAVASTSRIRRAALVVAAGLVLATCSADGGDDGHDATGAGPEDTVTAPDRYRPPDQHASDWGAPAVDLPDAPRPYGPSPEATADPAFYDVTTLDSAEVGAAESGDVLRSERVELTGPLRGASGWRMLYRSTDADGAAAMVSGMVLIPAGPSPAAGRPVVAWAHGTTGIADRCAPSATGNLFYDDYGEVGRRLLDQGFVVAATDYHGLGTPGVHTYHRSEDLARATIDSVAAAHRLDGTELLSPQWATVGHSEGGLAALAVDERAAGALPELDYLGSVVAAPTPRLSEVAPLMFAVPGRGYGALLLEAVAEVTPELDPAVALGPEAADRQSLLTHGCWEEAVPGFDDIEPDEMLADPAIGERLAEVMVDWADFDPAAAVGPLLVIQGGADTSVLPPFTGGLVDDLCTGRAAVEYRTYPGAGHDEVLAAAAEDMATWLAARLSGEPTSGGCRR